MRNQPAFVRFVEETPDRFASAFAVIERPVIDIHADEFIGEIEAHIARKLQRVLNRFGAMIEAELDFADEADVGEAASDAAWPELRSLADEIGAHLASHHRAEIIQDGFRVVIVGAPNAGKSSLLNALAQREAAIVTEEAGTTRDLIDVSLNLDGVKVVVTDTAGLREQAGRVEAIGMEKARKRAAGADLVLLLRDLSDPLEIEDRFGGVTVWRIATKVPER